MLSELVFEQIEGNFWYAAYGPFRVIMMKDTGYINASKMCMDGDKHFHHWKENKSSQALIHSVEKMLAIEAQTIQICDPGIPGSENLACKSITTQNRSAVAMLISGTYCHPNLILHIACWISPEFALKVSKVVNGYIVMECKAHLDAAKQELDAKQLALEQATELHEATTRDAHHAHLQRDAAIIDANRAQQQVQQKKHRHQVWSSTHGFTMLRLNNSSECCL